MCKKLSENQIDTPKNVLQFLTGNLEYTHTDIYIYMYIYIYCNSKSTREEHKSCENDKRHPWIL